MFISYHCHNHNINTHLSCHTYYACLYFIREYTETPFIGVLIHPEGYPEKTNSIFARKIKFCRLAGELVRVYRFGSLDYPRLGAALW